MIAKLLLILLLIYWAVRAVGNLARAVLGTGEAVPPRMAPPGNGAAPRTGPDRQAQPSRDPHDDVEDAKWVDL